MEQLDFIRNAELVEAPISDEHVASLVRELLTTVGEDPDREGLQRTPERVSRMVGELLAGYDTDVEALLNGAIFHTTNEDMVVVRDIEFYSLCEHHLLPFFGRVHVAYIPDGEVVGLSKIPRIVEMFARRLQIQEQMTQQIADCLDSILHPKGVAVIAEGAHMCGMMRGVRKDETRMTTTAMLGAFKNDAALRAELLAHLQRRDGAGF
jgi:GTP cyclohydrolase IA